MDPVIAVVGILTALLGISANAFIALLFWRLKRMDQDIEMFKRELMEIRLNYLDRFDDVKDHQNQLHLETVKKFGILEVLIKQHLK
jgi:hypothetical protein